MIREINRRKFVKNTFLGSATIALTPSLFTLGGATLSSFLTSCRQQKSHGKLYPETENSFPLLEIEGSYYGIGYAIGHRFTEQIKLVLHRRKVWFSKLQQVISGDGKSLYEGLLEKAVEFYPNLVKEMEGMAKGSGLSFDTIFLLNVKSEIGALLRNKKPETPGCSTIYLNRENKKQVFHNEDGNIACRDIMFVVKATPPSGVSFTVFTYPGIIMGNGPGINSFGISQTTNYIASERWNIGIPRYIVGRAVLESKSLDEAVKIVTQKNRAFAYHHNLASTKEQKILSVETTPNNYQIKNPKGVFFHTNHLIHESTKGLPQDMGYVNSSSKTRYDSITKNVTDLPEFSKITKEDIMKILSSHDNEPYSVCRHPKGDVAGITLGTTIIDVKNGTMDLYKGNPCISWPKLQYSRYSYLLATQ